MLLRIRLLATGSCISKPDGITVVHPVFHAFSMSFAGIPVGCTGCGKVVADLSPA
ncbi:MAG: hypothetical protein ACLQBD_21785 [Syntrophobacteraceae bacterium]